MSTRGKALIIGDSISGGYTPHVARILDGKFAVALNGGVENVKRDSATLLANLESYLAADGDADVIHFNCGLHDITRARDAEGARVPLASYRDNLTAIVERLAATEKKLIWATTTPVIFERHRRKGFDRRQEDVEQYNAVAHEIMTAAGIPINDLHAAVVAAGTEECLQRGGVHMTDRASEMLGKIVAEAIQRRAQA